MPNLMQTGQVMLVVGVLALGFVLSPGHVYWGLFLVGQEIWLVRSRESLVIDIIAQVSPLVENSQVINLRGESVWESCKMILWSIYQMSEFFFGITTKTDMKVCCWFMSVLSIEKRLYASFKYELFL